MTKVKRTKRVRIARVSKSIPSMGSCVKAVRTCIFPTSITNTLIGFGGGFSFKLSDLPAVTEFTNLYEEYKISRITIDFMPIATHLMIQPTGALPNLGPVIYHALDPTNVVAPGSYDDLFQNSDCKWNLMSKQFRRSWVPHYADTIASTALLSGYKPVTGFISTGYPDVPHYGFKFYINGSTTANTHVYQLIVKMTVCLKGLK